ncbi:MAG: hemerythrin family protein [Deltaproteobacteria bacterium]|nr:hemerythrin family protein [Deltaproteobacteria bacterium]
MALITWNPAFSVKVKQFDDQHIKLVDMINELYDAMKAGNGSETVAKILGQLVDYTVTHFTDEEQRLSQYAYPDLEAHKSEHEKLVRQVLDLQQKFEAGQAILTLNVMMFLKDWLMTHIQGDDKKYGDYLNGRGVI